MTQYTQPVVGQQQQLPQQTSPTQQQQQQNTTTQTTNNNNMNNNTAAATATAAPNATANNNQTQTVAVQHQQQPQANNNNSTNNNNNYSNPQPNSVPGSAGAGVGGPVYNPQLHATNMYVPAPHGMAAGPHHPHHQPGTMYSTMIPAPMSSNVYVNNVTANVNLHGWPHAAVHHGGWVHHGGAPQYIPGELPPEQGAPVMQSMGAMPVALPPTTPLPTAHAAGVSGGRGRGRGGGKGSRRGDYNMQRHASQQHHHQQQQQQRHEGSPAPQTGGSAQSNNQQSQEQQTMESQQQMISNIPYAAHAQPHYAAPHGPQYQYGYPYFAPQQQMLHAGQSPAAQQAAGAPLYFSPMPVYNGHPIYNYGYFIPPMMNPSEYQYLPAEEVMAGSVVDDRQASGEPSAMMWHQPHMYADEYGMNPNEMHAVGSDDMNHNAGSAADTPTSMLSPNYTPIYDPQMHEIQQQMGVMQIYDEQQMAQMQVMHSQPGGVPGQIEDDLSECGSQQSIPIQMVPAGAILTTAAGMPIQAPQQSGVEPMQMHQPRLVPVVGNNGNALMTIEQTTSTAQHQPQTTGDNNNVIDSNLQGNEFAAANSNTMQPCESVTSLNEETLQQSVENIAQDYQQQQQQQHIPPMVVEVQTAIGHMDTYNSNNNKISMTDVQELQENVAKSAAETMVPTMVAVTTTNVDVAIETTVMQNSPMPLPQQQEKSQQQPPQQQQQQQHYAQDKPQQQTSQYVATQTQGNQSVPQQQVQPQQPQNYKHQQQHAQQQQHHAAQQQYHHQQLQTQPSQPHHQAQQQQHHTPQQQQQQQQQQYPPPQQSHYHNYDNRKSSSQMYGNQQQSRRKYDYHNHGSNSNNEGASSASATQNQQQPTTKTMSWTNSSQHKKSTNTVAVTATPSLTHAGGYNKSTNASTNSSSTSSTSHGGGGGGGGGSHGTRTYTNQQHQQSYQQQQTTQTRNYGAMKMPSSPVASAPTSASGSGGVGGGGAVGHMERKTSQSSDTGKTHQQAATTSTASTTATPHHFQQTTAAASNQQSAHSHEAPASSSNSSTSGGKQHSGSARKQSTGQQSQTANITATNTAEATASPTINLAPPASATTQTAPSTPSWASLFRNAASSTTASSASPAAAAATTSNTNQSSNAANASASTGIATNSTTSSSTSTANYSQKPIAKVAPFESAAFATPAVTPGALSYSAASAQNLPPPSAATAAAAVAVVGNQKKITTNMASLDEFSMKFADFLTKYKSDWTTISLRPRGLTNRSNYCYINSILQALLGCSPLYNLMRSIPKQAANLCEVKAPTINAMMSFMSNFSNLPSGLRLRTAKGGKGNKDDLAAELQCDPAFEPTEIYKLWNDSREEHVEGRQEDAEEFLSYILNKLNDEMLEVVKLIAKPNAEQNGQNEQAEDGEDGDVWQMICNNRNKGSVTRQTDFGCTPLSDIFRGELRSRLQREGEHPTDVIQPFLTLPLNIEKAASVKEALEILVGRDQLEGVTGSKSKQEVLAWQQMNVEKLPPILILHLKWFDYRSDGCTKILKKVEFPVDLKIDTKILASKKYSQKQRAYRLFAVVYHDGKEASKGHYITDVYHTGYGSWLRYDDSSVKPIIENHVLLPRTPRVPYLLYYRRCDTIPQQNNNAGGAAGSGGSGNNNNNNSSTGANNASGGGASNASK
ncbi:putative mediator of RNA polymerase II transcription subunit 26 [Stomoxys calcitrans]|uniref:putative mediator of RNA polymerase II transcription subunit 26 n=1 Tax=Stomoxys calcitrans TaxID=35570 RepID=UPI0027E320DE|nr:putative mediator of RNA polymerase II transcription subunit 26 [Stomoxys calcitrans]XP_013104014.2 putative mediator of RNA polymerase II transcription subunit 26 [Stomoxys calcitrans]